MNSDVQEHVSRVSEAFTRMIYTHVLNRPGLHIRSSLDHPATADNLASE